VVFFSTITFIFHSNPSFCEAVSTSNTEKEQLKDLGKISYFFEQIKKEQRFLEPKVDFFDKEGGKYILFDFRGKLLLIYFWASWCNTCTEDLKILDYLKKELKFREIVDIEILPISIDFKKVDAIKTIYVTKKITNLELYLDPRKELMNAFQIKNVPNIVIIDKKGYVILQTNLIVNWRSDYFIQKLLEIRNLESQDINSNLEKENDMKVETNIISTKDRAKPIIIN